MDLWEGRGGKEGRGGEVKRGGEGRGGEGRGGEGRRGEGLLVMFVYFNYFKIMMHMQLFL